MFSNVASIMFICIRICYLVCLHLLPPLTTRKKIFNKSVLAQIDIAIGIDLINKNFLTFIKFHRLFKNLNKVTETF